MAPWPLKPGAAARIRTLFACLVRVGFFPPCLPSFYGDFPEAFAVFIGGLAALFVSRFPGGKTSTLFVDPIGNSPRPKLVTYWNYSYRSSLYMERFLLRTSR